MSKRGESIFKHRTFCIITGASQGLGRTMAVTLAAKLPAQSAMVIMARNHDNLQKTKELVTSAAPAVEVFPVAVDLARVTGAYFEKTFQYVLGALGAQPPAYEQLLLIHNAASLGDVTKTAKELTDKEMMQNYFELNVTAVLLLNSQTLKTFCDVTRQVVINVSSICALQPFKSWSLYCAGKAARDMLFRTMALEDPNIRVLNYAPGPLDTEMQVRARTETGDPELKTMFESMHSEGKLLTSEESVDKLACLLTANTWDSGAHIDYYDI